MTTENRIVTEEMIEAMEQGAFAEDLELARQVFVAMLSNRKPYDVDEHYCRTTARAAFTAAKAFFDECHQQRLDRSLYPPLTEQPAEAGRPS